jgi:hypothetical protein
MFKRYKPPTVPLAFYEQQLQAWSDERAALLNRIQHPSVFQPQVIRHEPPAPVPADGPTDDELWARVGTSDGTPPAEEPEEN